MNVKTLSLLTVMLSFLAGAFVAVLDPTRIDWSWMIPILLVGAAGLVMFRRAKHREVRAGDRITGGMETLARCLDNLERELQDLTSKKDALPVYEARFEIDRRLRHDLNAFAEARETMIHVFGMREYANVMSAFAAGERYVNRVWSASTDGYEDEVKNYLERAYRQFMEAQRLFQRLSSGDAAVQNNAPDSSVAGRA